MPGISAHPPRECSAGERGLPKRDSNPHLRFSRNARRMRMTRFPYSILFDLPELLRCRQSPFGEPIACNGSPKFSPLYSLSYRQAVSRVLFALSLSFSADFPLKTRCSAMRAKTIPGQYDSLTALFLSKIIEIKFRRLSKYGVFSIYFKNSLEFNCVL